MWHHPVVLHELRKTLFPAAVLLLSLAACGGEVLPGTAIRNVTTVDAVHGTRHEQTVVFDGDSITYSGPATEAPATDESIDGGGKYLIPGLWDFHVHLIYDDRFTPIMPASFLRYGVTSVRDTGGLLPKLLPVVNKIRSDGAPAPRIFFSGPLLDGEFVVYDGVSAPEIGIRNQTVRQAAQNVAALKAAGASFIKIYEMVSPEVFTALVAAAEENGLPIAAHVPLSLTASEAGPLVASMEHLRNIELDCASNWEELLETRERLLENKDGDPGYTLRSSLHSLQRLPAIERLDSDRCDDVLTELVNTTQVPTAGLNTIALNPMFERDDWPGALALMPESIREAWSQPPNWLPVDEARRNTRFAHYTMRMIARMNDRGIPIAAGTDTPIAHAIPGYSLLNELEILVASGLSPLEALEAATVVPAQFFSLHQEMGTIEVGKRADLVLLQADPLDDINNLRRIELVIAQGAVVAN
ncbi:MAG: amidohydrolase family protein [Woeseiaceae bacterium]